MGESDENFENYNVPINQDENMLDSENEENLQDVMYDYS
jgi:hypothetical protein